MKLVSFKIIRPPLMIHHPQNSSQSTADTLFSKQFTHHYWYAVLKIVHTSLLPHCPQYGPSYTLGIPFCQPRLIHRSQNSPPSTADTTFLKWSAFLCWKIPPPTRCWYTVLNFLSSCGKCFLEVILKNSAHCLLTLLSKIQEIQLLGDKLLTCAKHDDLRWPWVGNCLV